MTCPHCHESAKFEDYRDSDLHMLLGTGRHDRVYYHCKHCHNGWFPTDEELGIEHKQTPGCRELVSLTGTVEPFAEAAEMLLHKLAGLNLSASTVRVTTERVGAEVAERRAAGEVLGPKTPWDWQRDANGKRVAYVSLDATAVLQQGPDAEKAESRMPYVGSVFNPVPIHERLPKRDRSASSDGATPDSVVSESCSSESRSSESRSGKSRSGKSRSDKSRSGKSSASGHSRDPRTRAAHRVWPTRYVSGLMSLEEIGRQLRGECAAVGIANADVVLVVTDAGNGLDTCLVETVLSGLAREVVLILDFFHAAEHIRNFAKVWCDDCARPIQVEHWCHTLKHEGGRALLSDLESLDSTDCTDAQREAHRLLTNYIRNNQDRMDYPTYMANGWEIGSGEIESACNHVINHRLGASGMRWRPPGTTDLCELRSLYRSEFAVWQNYWSRHAAT